MSRNYYEILGISPDASQKEIAISYRNLALKWHPRLNKSDINTVYHKFCDISEAYEVLSDEDKRNFYDQYSEKILKEGILLEDGLKGGYRFNGNPEEIFEKFFGTDSPFPQIFEGDTKNEYGSLITQAFGVKNIDLIKGPENLIVTIDCTLGELYNGCKKIIEYEKTVLNLDDRTLRKIKETKELEIKKGYSKNSEIIFKGMGNEANGIPNSDLIFKINELPNPNYKRKDSNLIYYSKIQLVDALCAESVSLTTLDGRKLFIAIDKIINPNTIKSIRGEGMPIYNPDEFLVENYQKELPKGDLEIKFDICFPKKLTNEQKMKLKSLLPN